MTAYARVTLSDNQIMTTLREVVAERPYFIYSPPEHHDDDTARCYYVHVDENGDNETPGCLVGAVLNRLGVPLDVLAKYEGSGAGSVSRAVANVSDTAALALAVAQDAQDNGAAWSRALEAAEQYAPVAAFI
ncbi:hypothetical protein [Kitasatospora cathayae]|uniref:Uncharacterized protein n=1 Tax=Kitasatospora cathayae TaxID=3004092 RepID=A0ABY7Q319_9ACTN|nr:hypothetical protein [Kitasatospora sp. HUAS 3-15]WBP87026.1 hypothetical protein O1G21_15030 [Kitasatospora sp. HUAS 3-15]